MVFPQLVRTLRNPGTGGVSAASWTLTAVCSLTWLMYGFKAGVMPQIPGNVVIVPGAIAIVLTAPAALAVTYRAAALASAIAAVFAAAMFLRPETLGYLAFAIGLIAAFPQTLKSVLRSRSPGASAVSVPSWLMRALSQVFWLAYGLARRDFPIITGAVVTLVISLVLLVAESREQSRAPDAAAELSVSSLPSMTSPAVPLVTSPSAEPRSVAATAPAPGRNGRNRHRPDRGRPRPPPGRVLANPVPVLVPLHRVEPVHDALLGDAGGGRTHACVGGAHARAAELPVDLERLLPRPRLRPGPPADHLRPRRFLRPLPRPDQPAVGGGDTCLPAGNSAQFRVPAAVHLGNSLRLGQGAGRDGPVSIEWEDPGDGRIASAPEALAHIASFNAIQPPAASFERHLAAAVSSARE